MANQPKKPEARALVPVHNMEWYQVVDLMRPHIVRIFTPRGSGTGFLLARRANSKIAAIATAGHVVAQSHFWDEPIRLQHAESNQWRLIRSHERAIILHDDDTAAITLDLEGLPLPEATLPLAPKDKGVKVGIEIGWLGFPAIPEAELCFFGGRVSAWLKEEAGYLVDGVAINGVSGGPAFWVVGDIVSIMGVVTAYRPNRATGETLPGLSVVRTVQKLHGIVAELKNLDEAIAQQTPPSESVPPSEARPTDIEPTRRPGPVR